MFLEIALILVIVCQMLFHDSRMTIRTKALTGLLVLSTILLSGKWVLVTGGRELFASHQATAKKHSVTIHWNASTTRGSRYNIYRGTAHGNHPEKLNAVPVGDLSFTDDKVISGKTYYYVARAVDSSGHESGDSEEISVTVP